MEERYGDLNNQETSFREQEKTKQQIPKTPQTRDDETNLSQTVPLAEGLVRHVLELVRHRAGTPTRRVVLDHRGVELRHLRSLQWTHSMLLYWHAQGILY